MSLYSDAKLKMLYGFGDAMTPFSAITGPIPNFTSNLGIVTSSVPQISKLFEAIMVSRKGLTDNKNVIKRNLAVMTGDVSAKLRAYYKFNNNTASAGEVNFYEGKLKVMGDIELRDVAQIVYDRAQLNVAALGVYGITAATQTSFLTLINGYVSALTKQSSKSSDLAQLKQQLESLFKSVDVAFENLDTGAEIVRLSQPVFYAAYKNARKIVVKGAGSLAVKGSVRDVLGGASIAGATIVLTLVDDLGVARMSAKGKSVSLVKKSAAKGGFKIKSLAPGIYEARVTKFGYVEEVLQLVVNSDATSELTVTLKKI